MPKFIIPGIVLFLLLVAGYGLATIQAARSIPWDCSDWQAFAHADRTTAILESLAENRGKTLYCGIDQSDTFTKAETWAAGKDRNERDDTVYFGERGQFRGFIAAQEGWLTEGESGVTGVSIDRIFEFPREERRRTKRVKRFKVGTTADINAVASCGQADVLICSDWGADPVTPVGTESIGQRAARQIAVGRTLSQPTNWTLHWQTNIITRSGDTDSVSTPSAAWWQGQAETAADAAAARLCQARGAKYVAGSAQFGPGHNHNKGSNGDNLGWFYGPNLETGGSTYRYQARQSRTWTATCKKVIRRSRR